jgi:hypothetical protein
MKDKATNVIEEKLRKHKPSNFWRIIAVLCLGVSSIIADAYWIFEHHHYLAIVVGLVVFVGLLYQTLHDEVIGLTLFILLSITAVIFCGTLGYYVGPNFPGRDGNTWMVISSQ